MNQAKAPARKHWRNFKNWIGIGKPTPAQLLAASESLTNPAMRVVAPDGFPEVIKERDTKRLLELIETELREKYHTSLQEAGHINIVYPHKDPRLFPYYKNHAEYFVEDLVEALTYTARDTEWRRIDALTELVHLDRSGNQKCDHAMGDNQLYACDPEADPKTPFPLPVGEGKREFFILADWMIEQGTTIANLNSFVTANGGTVLAAVSAGGTSLRQIAPHNNAELIKQAGLRPEFNDASANTGMLPKMALAFARAAKEEGSDMTPQQALDQFEERLNKLGRSVFTMTHNEVGHAINTVTIRGEMQMTFSELLKRLERKAPKPRAPAA